MLCVDQIEYFAYIVVQVYNSNVTAGFKCFYLDVYCDAGELFANTKRLMAKWKNILDQYLNTEDDQVFCDDTLLFDRIVTATYMWSYWLYSLQRSFRVLEANMKCMLMFERQKCSLNLKRFAWRQAKHLRRFSAM